MAEIRIDVEANFLDLYMQAVGRTEVPDQFHRWTALSLLAACLEHRVWMEKLAYQRIYPNQYVFLIGNPASGKGTAINLGKRVMDAAESQGYPLRYYRGAITRAALQDWMTEKWKGMLEEWEKLRDQGYEVERPPSTPLFFMAPELSSGMHVGAQAKDLIKLLTDFWEGDIGKYSERTRMHGLHEFENPCINCLVGSAPEWCREVVDAGDLASGFWARVACVTGERDHRPQNRIYEPDTTMWDRSLAVLAWRLSLLMSGVHEQDLAFKGLMQLSPEAARLDRNWYMNRPVPDEGLYEAHWARQPGQVARLAMLLKLCDFWELESMGDSAPGEGWRRIEAHHWEQALHMSEEALQNASQFLGQSLSYTFSPKQTRVEEAVRRRGRIMQRPDLVKVMSRYGVKAKEVEAALQALEEEGKIHRWSLTGGNYMVAWGERREG